MAVQTSIYKPVSGEYEGRGFNDARRYRRVQLSLQARFMRADRTEHPCLLKDISVAGASFLTPVKVAMGERIIVYIDHLGGLEGVATRAMSDGFAFHFKVSDHKREKLAAQLMWLINRDDFPEDVGRVHERTRPSGRRAMLTVADGVVIDVEVIDLSASGAACSTPARPPIGSFVALNKVHAIVKRHHDTGIGLQFLSVLNPEALKSHFS